MSDEAKGAAIAMELFEAGIKSCANEDQTGGYAAVLCKLSTQLIGGMEGQAFKKTFLKAAIKDKGTITIHRLQQ